MSDYLARIWSAFSQMLNVIMLNGDPNESISGRCYRQKWIKPMLIINACFFWQSNHCRGAYNKDRVWATQYLQG